MTFSLLNSSGLTACTYVHIGASAFRPPSRIPGDTNGLPTEKYPNYRRADAKWWARCIANHTANNTETMDPKSRTAAGANLTIGAWPGRYRR